MTHAVLIEPEHGGELHALLQRRGFAMLPLANRPLLHHQLSRLAQAGIREVDLFLAHQPQQTRDFAAAGQAWGLVLRCHSVGASERLWTEPGRLARCVREASLVLAMDLWPDGQTLAQLCRPQAHGSRWLRDAGGALLRLGRLEAGSAPLHGAPGQNVPSLKQARAYVDANLAEHAALAGTLHVERCLAPGVYAGSGVRLDETAELPGRVLLGAGAVVGGRCRVGDGAIVGAGAWIDDACELADCVLLADTYVGPHTLLHGKVVDQGCVIDCATGLTLHVDDPRLLAGTAAHLFSRPLLNGAWERALAVAGLALLAPALALRAAWQCVRRQPLFEPETRYLPPGRALTGAPLARALPLLALAGVAHPGWRRLPWLLAVARGALPLVGTALPARTPHAALADGAHHCAMLSCVDDAVLPTLAPNDFLRDAGPRLSARVLLGWLASLCRRTPGRRPSPATPMSTTRQGTPS